MTDNPIQFVITMSVLQTLCVFSKIFSVQWCQKVSFLVVSKKNAIQEMKDKTAEQKHKILKEGVKHKRVRHLV